jgi:hypothetical protein
MPKTITFTFEVPDNFDSFSDLETFVNHQGQKLKQELCQKLAQSSTTENSSSCPKCGHAESIAKGHKERKLKTIFGDSCIQQPRRQCQKCRSYFFPMGAWLESEGNVTPQLKEMATLCAASWPYEVASTTLERLTSVSLCAKEIQLLTEQVACEAREEDKKGYSEAVATTTKIAMEQLSSTPIVPPEAQGNRVYLGFDGIYVHSRDSQHGIEGKVGIIFSGDDDDRTQISKERNVLLEKEYIASFENSGTLAQKAYSVVWNNNFVAEEMIVLGDGARWIRKVRDNYFPKARYILDWWHLKEKVKRCLRDTLTDGQTRVKRARTFGL